ncbi:hypothetical protein [Streptomyces sp. NRRL F-5650]|uniref:hypothetical protein n=1 Tax=Streptomyces sp. NRRL F-5650 TaxID=1463868 RepID=UPI00099DFC14
MSSMSQPRPQGRPRSEPPASAGVPMRDLLASCAAAKAVSTPPRAPEPETRRPLRDRAGHLDGQVGHDGCDGHVACDGHDRRKAA